MATCFGGGYGRCKDELCGALAGGAMALGLLFGRDAPGANWDTAAKLSAALRQRVIERYGSPTCRVLLDRFEPQDNWSRCKELVAATVGILHDLVEDERSGVTAAA
jgi:C_GCAxxG_C_C family probable redox protein